MASAISHFVLNALDTTIELGVAGSIFSESIPAIDVSAVAVIEVGLDMMREIFKYQTDADDVQNAADADTHYYIDTVAWEGLADVNPANAMLNHPESSGAITSLNAAGVDLPADKQLVCHDFVRYLALRLFNTHFGVDLFQNELELLEDIRAKCSSTAEGNVWYEVKSKLEAVDTTNALGGEDTDGNKYTTNDDTASTNLCRVLMLQMLNQQIARFQNIENSGSAQSLPFLAGDSISFKVIVNPAPEQELATGVEPFAGRSYEIRLSIVESPTNTEVAADESA